MQLSSQLIVVLKFLLFMALGIQAIEDISGTKPNLVLKGLSFVKTARSKFVWNKLLLTFLLTWYNNVGL